MTCFCATLSYTKPPCTSLEAEPESSPPATRMENVARWTLQSRTTSGQTCAPSCAAPKARRRPGRGSLLGTVQGCSAKSAGSKAAGSKAAGEWNPWYDDEAWGDAKPKRRTADDKPKPAKASGAKAKAKASPKASAKASAAKAASKKAKATKRDKDNASAHTSEGSDSTRRCRNWPHKKGRGITAYSGDGLVLGFVTCRWAARGCGLCEKSDFKGRRWNSIVHRDGYC